ncbi:MAG TPA: precorrin-4 C(11)-methyltransferase [Dissulfurispiraceae bacterium]|nr:precorrin-4 C(11)-methyltransferase [Dissulfurispiraceae bacterium]
MAKVFFVGAGPGDPELITVKGAGLLKSADVVIFAGSLVNRMLLVGLRAELYDSAPMNLEEIIGVMDRAVKDGRNVVRLHTGDPSLFGAISEQIEKLKLLGIDYEIIPGVSSGLAGAAVLGQELTIPEISQTVIFTRMAGKTPVPEEESIGKLAAHKASMVIFLSVGMIDVLVKELLRGYSDTTPVVVIEKATWLEQRIVRGNIRDIAAKVKEAGISKTALVYVGEALGASEIPTGKTSLLYDRAFSHGFRKASE